MEKLVEKILSRVASEKELLKRRESILENSALRYGIQNKIRMLEWVESMIKEETEDGE